jgi:hypothetical protein
METFERANRPYKVLELDLIVRLPDLQGWVGFFGFAK